MSSGKAENEELTDSERVRRLEAMVQEVRSETTPTTGASTGASTEERPVTPTGQGTMADAMTETPHEVREYMSENIFEGTPTTHVADPKNPAHRKLFGKGQGGGEGKEQEGGVLHWLGLAGGRKRRRKKSRKSKKKSKSKKRRRKSRRKKRRKSNKRKSRRRRKKSRKRRR